MTAALTLVPDPVASPAPDPEPYLRRARFDRNSYLGEDVYYDGGVRLQSMGWSLPPELAVLQVVVNWPAMAVDALNQRLHESGFRFRGQAQPSQALADLWAEARLPAEAQLCRLEALVHRRAYWTVGGRPSSDVPVVRAESRIDVWADVDPRTGDVLAAVRHGERTDTMPETCTILLPEATYAYERRAGGWAEVDRIEHGLGVVPVVPMVHAARVRRRGGTSLMDRVVGLTDACSRTLTNLGGAQELLAVPQRFVLGAEAKDFTDPVTGARKTPWEAYLGRFIALSNKDAQIGQLSAADLRNFTEVVNLYAKLVSGVAGLPPDYLGYSDANPASADAIYASRERLITNAEACFVPMGDAHERLMMILLRWTGEDTDPAPLECIWADPATPTLAAKADAATKLYTAGLIPREAAWDMIGVSPDDQRRWAALLSEDPLERYMAGGLNGAGALNAAGAGGGAGGAGSDLGGAAARDDAAARRAGPGPG